MLKAGARPEFAYATKADDASHQIGYDTKSANETVEKNLAGRSRAPFYPRTVRETNMHETMRLQELASYRHVIDPQTHGMSVPSLFYQGGSRPHRRKIKSGRLPLSRSDAALTGRSGARGANE